MVWVKTYKKNVKIGLPNYCNIVKGKIVETSNTPKGKWKKVI